MIVSAKTDIGVKRHSNQDEYAILNLNDGSVLAVVCDGMGGANAGNVASHIACQVITSFFERSFRLGLNPEGVMALLQSAILSANIEVFNMASKNVELSGMGTTVVAAFVSKDFTVVSHVGDSRAYIIGDDVTQLTRDHSVVQSLIESGKLTPEEAVIHPRRNVITRALGIEPDILVDSDEYDLKENDFLLLCSDGLSNFASTDEMSQIFNKTKAEQIADELVKCANKNGGGDNITAVVVKKG
ncbi:MAG: Stp1/IreP family PP2C-type Ser/Thr phosphatase [Clostridia bacterium]|nr:Stp1/IreP family PP2C-type Ser/Thr phosphatase [Clostridia bacterium]